MSTAEPWTIDRLLTWTASYFSENASESPRLDAEVLLSKAMDCQRIELYARYDQVPEENQLTEFRSWVRRRADGEPVAYLVGHKEFYSLPFIVTKDVLIPRPETEGLVVETLGLVEKISARDRPIRIADVGTGSGIIAVTLAKHLPNVEIVAFEISQNAIEIAKQNANQHGVSERIEFRLSDLLAQSSVDEQFDIIVSNPPYVGTDERDSLPKSVVAFEPPEALFAGNDGTQVIARLVKESTRHLTVEGFLIMEISPNIAKRVIEIVNAQNHFGGPKIKKDSAGLDRIVIAKARSEKKQAD